MRFLFFPYNFVLPGLAIVDVTVEKGNSIKRIIKIIIKFTVKSLQIDMTSAR